MVLKKVIEGKLITHDYILSRADFEIEGCNKFPDIIHSFDGKRVRISIEEVE